MLFTQIAYKLTLELASLTIAQILETKRESNRVYCKANLDSPGIEELQSLFIKTTGLADQIKSTFKLLYPEMDAAFVYGSLARSDVLATSDVDIMIIGSLKFTRFSTVVKDLSPLIERDLAGA